MNDTSGEAWYHDTTWHEAGRCSVSGSQHLQKHWDAKQIPWGSPWDTWKSVLEAWQLYSSKRSACTCNPLVSAGHSSPSVLIHRDYKLLQSTATELWFFSSRCSSSCFLLGRSPVQLPVHRPRGRVSHVHSACVNGG